MFEICSMKIFMRGEYQVHSELTKDYVSFTQTDEDLLKDLSILRNLIPLNKKIIFQSHFRPNIIFKDPSKTIKNREIIYNTLKKFCDNKNNNCYCYDPSVILAENNELFDGYTHFNDKGYAANYKFICEHYL
jgi:hypothetical protein